MRVVKFDRYGRCWLGVGPDPRCNPPKPTDAEICHVKIGCNPLVGGFILDFVDAGAILGCRVTDDWVAVTRQYVLKLPIQNSVYFVDVRPCDPIPAGTNIVPAQETTPAHYEFYLEGCRSVWIDILEAIGWYDYTAFSL